MHTDIDKNIRHITNIYSNCGDFIKREFFISKDKKIKTCLIYIDSLVNSKMLNQFVIQPLMLNSNLNSEKGDSLLYDIKRSFITASDLKDTDDFDQVNNAVLSGDTALFVDTCQNAIIISSKGWPSRGVQAPETEVVVQGPKEAFSESLRVNTTLIRRRIRDLNLKVHQLKLGTRSQTDVALMYISDIVRTNVLEELLKRLNDINIDAVMDSGYIEQLIQDHWISPFPQTQVTERPDKAAAAILEGRIAIISDNSPFAVIVPSCFNVFFQSSEDYYQNFEIMSFVRVLRYFCAFISFLLSGLYISISIFNPSMIPLHLALKMSAARESVPFPPVIEVLFMELAFELLREAGIRLPGAVGSTIGIVGGLIIGQAAVEAGLVSPIVVIVVALTGISSFAIPHISLVSGFRIVKYLVIILSAMWGIYGFWLAFILILCHLSSMNSFGIPYMYPFCSGELNNFIDMEDSLIRFPIFAMNKLPIFANTKNSNRFKIKPRKGR